MNYDFVEENLTQSILTVFGESLWSFPCASLQEVKKVEKIFFFFSVPEVFEIFSSK